MTDWHEDLLERIEARTATVGIVGLGYVGLPLALHAQAAGFRVMGVESDPERVDALRAGTSYIEDVAAEDVGRALGSGGLSVATDFGGLGGVDVVLICVPTPLMGGAPDLSFVLAAADELATNLKRHSIVILESTTYPGTTEEVLGPRLEVEGLVVGEDFSLAFSPERIDPGNAAHELASIPKIVGGVTPTCARLAEAFYSTIFDRVLVVSRPREAEMAKLLENTYRQVNIALINEFAMVANELDIDIWEVVDAAATKPFGFEPFYPGVGIGGHCIAVDPVYLTWRIRELKRAPFRLVELARDIDASMPTYVARRIEGVLKDKAGKNPRGAKVLALGVTYKPDIADLRESRALDVIERLCEEGIDVSFHDPFHDVIQVGERTLKAVDLEEGLRDNDLVAVLTHHSSYDWDAVVDGAQLVFDARGVTKGMSASNVVRL